MCIVDEINKSKFGGIIKIFRNSYTEISLSGSIAAERLKQELSPIHKYLCGQLLCVLLSYTVEQENQQIAR